MMPTSRNPTDLLAGVQLMRHWWAGVLMVLVVSLVAPHPSFAAGTATLYRVNLTPQAQDLYLETSTHLVFQTRYCYEYVYYEDAVYDDGQRRITFRNGKQCDVTQVLGATSTGASTGGSTGGSTTSATSRSGIEPVGV